MLYSVTYGGWSKKYHFSLYNLTAKDWQKMLKTGRKTPKALVKQIYYFFAQLQQFCTKMYVKLQ